MTTEVAARQLKFEGLPVEADHPLAFSGTVDLTADQAARLKLGQAVRLMVTCVVVHDGHKHKTDKDSGIEAAVHAFKAKVVSAEWG